MLLDCIETSSAVSYGDTAELRRDDRAQWAEAIEAARRSLGLPLVKS